MTKQNKLYFLFEFRNIIVVIWLKNYESEAITSDSQFLRHFLYVYILLAVVILRSTLAFLVITSSLGVIPLIINHNF